MAEGRQMESDWEDVSEEYRGPLMDRPNYCNRLCLPGWFPLFQARTLSAALELPET
jgi:hypothetical protein